MATGQSGGGTDHAAMIARIEQANFPSTMRGDGYAKRDVDDYLGEITRTLRAGRLPNPAWLASVQLSRAGRLRPAYQAAQVDALRVEIAHYVGSGEQDAAEHAGMITRIQGARFATVRNQGYDEEEVDKFLERVVRALSAGRPPDPGWVHDARFSVARMRPGYAQRDVENLLGAIESYASRELPADS